MVVLLGGNYLSFRYVCILAYKGLGGKLSKCNVLLIFSLDGSIKVFWALCIPVLWMLSTFSLANICNYTVSLQLLDVTTKIYRNFHRKVLPQSRNGRKLKMPLPERVMLTSSLDNISVLMPFSGSSITPPPPYERRGVLGKSGGEKIPEYQNFSLNAADVIIGTGYDLVDIYELTNQALGGMILLQISSSWILSLFHFSMFLSIFRPVIFSASVFSGDL